MRYLVTGGAGFIGLTFVDLLARNFPDIEIIVLDKLTYAAQEFEIDRLVKKHKIKFVKVDTDLFPDLVDKYNMQGLPLFGLFINGQIVSTHSGALNREGLKSFVVNGLQKNNLSI